MRVVASWEAKHTDALFNAAPIGDHSPPAATRDDEPRHGGRARTTARRNPPLGTLSPSAHATCSLRARRAGRPLLCLFALLAAQQAGAQTLRELGDLSLEQLSQVEITSVSKRAEPLSRAPAAVYVITSDDIRRSGATSLAEALRLAPNLEVARVSSQAYNISSRGMNSVNASNKLLVLIDGRSIYTPFFSSVFWDQQDVMLADVERIEVISGPGGTLWGSNAVNGVINVITKTSAQTQGGLVDVKAGDFLQRGEGRYGGKLGDLGTYRVYALGFDQGSTRRPSGASAMDDWRGKQAGFRADLATPGNRYTLQGDAYDNVIDTPGGRRRGGDVLGRWNRSFAHGSLTVQAYYDQQDRDVRDIAGGGSFERTRTLDIEIEHSIDLGTHQIVWGAGHRTWRDSFTNTANPFVLTPPAETLDVTNEFAQDTVKLRDDLRLTFGSKFEYSTFSGWEVMPNVRVGWQANADNFAWAAISRAVRAPSRLERDLTAPGIVNPSPDFQAEKLVAYEAGWRAQVSRVASISASVFHDDYDDLRTTKPNEVTVLPVTFGNGWKGYTYGTDVWGSVSLAGWWRLDAGFEILRKHFHLKPGERDIAGSQTVLGHDPGHQVFLRSFFDLGLDVELYVGLRQVGALPDVGVPSYTEADVRLGWSVTPTLELSLTGENLLHRFHAEAIEPPVNQVPRSVFVGVRWSF
jgi:iron complex outermembrane receptor protein